MCRFSIHDELSPAIATVGIVDWSSDFPGIERARIEFGPTGSALDLTAPAEPPAPRSRTLLLGMKAEAAYSFRLVVESAAGSCKSPELDLTTGPVPDWVPVITKQGGGASAAEGYIVTTPGLSLFVDGRGLPSAYIFDTDGDVVWWTPETIEDICRAEMSWDGQTMWFVSAYGDSIFSVSMDGLTVVEHPIENGADHDLTVLPDGGVAMILTGSPGPAGEDGVNSVVELRPDGSFEMVVADLDTVMDLSHPNALHYYESDDSFTLSDLDANAFVKFKHSGELVWQLGGDSPIGDSFELLGLLPWNDNHGHHLTSDGRFFFFNNATETEGGEATSRAVMLQLNEEEWTAEMAWEYIPDPPRSSAQLGDVELLPNGNVLVTISNSGIMNEVTLEGEVVQSFDNSVSFETSENSGYALFGYANFRTSLYGPPPR